MKTETKSLMLAAAAMAGLLTGCATQKKECPTCGATKTEKAKADCGAKHGCQGKNSCGGKNGCGSKDGCGAKHGCHGKKKS